MPASDTIVEDLHQALMANAVVPEPAEDPPPAEETLPVFSNFEWVEGKQKAIRRGLPMQVIYNELDTLTGGWPKRVDNLLFVPGANYQPRYIESTAQLFAWMDAQSFIDWGRSSDMVSQERLLAHLQETAEHFDAIERFPQWPALPDTYYMFPPLPATAGEYLREFVNFFSPLTEVDRELITAFILSLFWGGAAGSRPAWLFTASANDPRGGRGVGKSKVCELCSELVGGFVEISAREDIVDLKKRLLSPAARTIRVARLDNIKTLRFSWADLEGLITSPVISGRQLYRGEGRRPNTLTWVLTLNGASLSRDMAQRVIVVKLARPRFNASWETEVRDYIQQHRWHILGDIGLQLQGQ